VLVQMGLAWFSGDRVDQMRHSCRDSDQLQRWGWQRHDGVGYGEQWLGDAAHGVVSAVAVIVVVWCGPDARPAVFVLP
jgi:hypothetical protein